MARIKKLSAGLTVISLLFTSFTLTACNKKVSGTFANLEASQSTNMQTTEETTAATSRQSDPTSNLNPVTTQDPLSGNPQSLDKDALFNYFEDVDDSVIKQVEMLCKPQIGGDDGVVYSNEKDLYVRLSPESQKLVDIKDIRFISSSVSYEEEIDLSQIEDPDFQKALAPYIKDGYSISSKVSEDSMTYNGERLVGDLYFNTGYHINGSDGNEDHHGFLVKITDELFQTYIFTLSQKASYESSMGYNFDVTKKDDVYKVEITGQETNNIEIEYDTSSDIMTYIIKIDFSDD
ncbi:MAG: hypothetical protein IKG93_08005 [Clostridiales bacterium]|nr:hypothetical protein [Clostridiales bacterium]